METKLQRLFNVSSQPSFPERLNLNVEYKRIDRLVKMRGREKMLKGGGGGRWASDGGGARSSSRAQPL